MARDGGRTWKVVFRTPRPVSWIGYDSSGRPRAILDDGENIGGRHWQPEVALQQELSPCVRSRAVFSGSWVLCIGQGSAGEGSKSVYRAGDRGWGRCGRLPVSGYAPGIAMARDGFGLVWESRGGRGSARRRGWVLLLRNGGVRLLRTTDRDAPGAACTAGARRGR